MNETNIVETVLEKLSDEELMAIRFNFSMPWQYDEYEEGYKDPDGFIARRSNKSSVNENRDTLQAECWSKFHRSPHINTAVRGIQGRLTGLGFEISSEIFDIQQVIEETEYDPRNRLYNFWPKYIVRSFVEGELFLILTVHDNGFVEVDFADPATLGADGASDGIIYHPSKTYLPLIYCFKDSKGNEEHIPSVFLARYPEMLSIAKQQEGFKEDLLKNSRQNGQKFGKLGGFYRFVVSWDRSFITARNISYIRTTLEWLNHYETLKKYEIDHKKSSGAYLWVVEMEDAKTFRSWLSLSDEEKRKTGIMAKKTPGGTLVLPPGMKLSAVNPNLQKISESDTDILHMVTSGLNEPEDVSTGQSKGTFASVKASRGPMSDRVSDEIAYFDRFLRYDFYSAIFFLRSSVTVFPSTFKKRTVVDFDNKKPIFKDVDYRPEFLLDIAYPISEVIDAEARARAYLGVKHGSTYDTLGVPNAEIARKMGLGNYKRLRLQQAEEGDKYPDLLSAVDQESVQDKKLEPGIIKRKKVGEGK